MGSVAPSRHHDAVGMNIHDVAWIKRSADPSRRSALVAPGALGYFKTMTDRDRNQVINFDAEHAERYDRAFERLQPVKDALHLFTGFIFSALPDDARVLVVGAGTGQEILALGQQRPGWRFTAVDTSPPMLAVAQRKLRAAGLADRCVFHAGQLAALEDRTPFDAATSILVSHFFVDPTARRTFFRQIRARLAAGGLLVNADLSSSGSSGEDAAVRTIWRRAFTFAGFEQEQVDAVLNTYGQDVALSTCQELADIMTDAGFGPPACFYQMGFIRAWYTLADGA